MATYMKEMDANFSLVYILYYSLTRNKSLLILHSAGSRDDLKSPSSRLVVGRLVAGGTGCFDLISQPI